MFLVLSLKRKSKKTILLPSKEQFPKKTLGKDIFLGNGL